MPDRDATNLVRAIVGAELSSTDMVRREDILPPGPVVTISRGYGAGGLEIARALAERLKVRVFDKEILDAVVEHAGVDRFLMERLDEHVHRTVDDVILSLFTKKSSTLEDYRKHLVNVVFGIAQTGGVIVGRGGNYILGMDRAFRVRIACTCERCARNIAKRRGVSIDEARKLVEETNKERREFLRRVFKADWDNVALYDLVISSDRYDTAQVVDLILTGMKTAGLKLPRGVMKKS